MSYSSSDNNTWNDPDENGSFIYGYFLDDDEDVVTCPACDGRGMNRWEDDDCSECWGEGVVPRG